MQTLIGLPILIFALMFQMAVLSQMTLLQASADLVMVVVASWIIQERVKTVWPWAVMAAILVGFVSELPMWGYLSGYVLFAGLGLVLKRRVWRAPLLALFTMVFFGTLLLQGMMFVILRFLGAVIDPLQAFNLVILPGVLLNLLLAIPVNSLIREVAIWFSPEEAEG
ncbi:MAG: hypothetical protein HUU38_21690 [Anaerolineales bacterium]|nr:hypothetical protein [Anaerolineales bacterium]